ncbi:MAG: adenylyltransferase/cytidyltransferase family protein, partial [Bacteroidota bacterium]|nr:adenylyltransferase/cytidyltransferase family protein [Bacteroidota bacterium]
MRPALPLEQKLYSRAALLERAASWRAVGEKLVFTNGCFDLLHPGHVDYLHRAALLGDRLIIGLNSDASVKRLKGPGRPIQPEKARALVLAGLTVTDAITFFSEDTPREIISTLLPDFLVKGADYNVHDISGASEVLRNGGSVV